MRIDLKAHGLRVKPLEWSPFECLCSRAVAGETVYMVIDHVDGFHAMHYYEFGEQMLGLLETVDAAKAACQAHHESQVLALLQQVEGGQ